MLDFLGGLRLGVEMPAAACMNRQGKKWSGDKNNGFDEENDVDHRYRPGSINLPLNRNEHSLTSTHLRQLQVQYICYFYLWNTTSVYGELDTQQAICTSNISKAHTHSCTVCSINSELHPTHTWRWFFQCDSNQIFIDVPHSGYSVCFFRHLQHNTSVSFEPAMM